jgi:hypothetical protein
MSRVIAEGAKSGGEAAAISNALRTTRSTFDLLEYHNPAA